MSTRFEISKDLYSDLFSKPGCLIHLYIDISAAVWAWYLTCAYAWLDSSSVGFHFMLIHILGKTIFLNSFFKLCMAAILQAYQLVEMLFPQQLNALRCDYFLVLPCTRFQNQSCQIWWRCTISWYIEVITQLIFLDRDVRESAVHGEQRANSHRALAINISDNLLDEETAWDHSQAFNLCQGKRWIRFCVSPETVLVEGKGFKLQTFSAIRLQWRRWICSVSQDHWGVGREYSMDQRYSICRRWSF